MLLEIAKPVALTLCLLSLFAVFHAAFFVPASDLQQRIWSSVELMSLAAGICLASGLIFRDSARAGGGSLTSTLPVQLFCWALGLILILFLVSGYLETYCVFYRDVRRF
jgi:formate/nitrite transporter FocA (FNT family)